MSEHRSGPVFRAGRDQHVDYSEKGPATQTAHVSNVKGSADTAILAELQELRKLLAGLGPPAASSTAQVEHAEQVASCSSSWPRRLYPGRFHLNRVLWRESWRNPRTGSGFPLSRNSRPPFLKSPTSW